MKLTFILTLCFISSSHPIMLIMIMILTTLTLNMCMYTYMKFSWFIFMITLLILGGLLVIFLYITSLTPNKKFSFKKFMYYMIPLFLILHPYQITNSTSNYQISMLFLPNSLIMLMFTLIYLMLTLITIMILIKSTMAPLKSHN
uniref:NADH dehydrogenase subunit 6 n=1 Tax=Alectorobius atacamensis TaxID=1826597 RepID=UPI00223817E7|nr:NADH dehydrogenase subunit 6 [Alectorobius atacamensis]UYB78194.1 NADH dehydrogenase subunit 6 [Alectorobius atacamensis]